MGGFSRGFPYNETDHKNQDVRIHNDGPEDERFERPEASHTISLSVFDRVGKKLSNRYLRHKLDQAK